MECLFALQEHTILPQNRLFRTLIRGPAMTVIIIHGVCGVIMMGRNCLTARQSFHAVNTVDTAASGILEADNFLADLIDDHKLPPQKLHLIGY